MVSAAAQQGLRVVVSSRNRVKIDAVAGALRQALPHVHHHVQGSESESGVPDQPFGDEETLRGAFNRVSSIAPRHQDGSSLLVAIEGGVGLVAPLPPQQAAAPAAASSSQQQDQGGLHALRQRLRPGERLPQLECFAWVVVQAPCGATSHARSASFPLPPAVSELMLREGLELGDADDAVFGRVKSGRGSGTIGQLTGGLITRQLYYEHAALCALVPLMNPQHYAAWDWARLPALQGGGGPERAGDVAAAEAGECL